MNLPHIVTQLPDRSSWSFIHPTRSSWSFIHIFGTIPVEAYLITGFIVIMFLGVVWTLLRAAALGDQQMEHYYSELRTPPMAPTFTPSAPPAGTAGVRVGRSTHTDPGSHPSA